MDFRRAALRGTVARFVRDERGDITNFMLPSFVALVFTTGLGIDLIRHEANRADLQNALDRGVLAAASCVQGDDYRDVVERYVDARMFNDREAVLSFNEASSGVVVGVDGETPVNCTVIAGANAGFDTSFLNLIGVPELNVGALASASEQQTFENEISLVLDISASMARETVLGLDGVTVDTRLEVMKAAAIDFINDNLGGPGQEGTSISLVPFSGQVNVGRFQDVLREAGDDDGSSAGQGGDDGDDDDDGGATAGGGGSDDGGEFVVSDESLFTVFTGGSRDHSHSSCIEFDDDSDFDTLALPDPGTSAQVPNFQAFSFERLRGQTLPLDQEGGNDANWGWCPEDELAVVPFSNSAEDLVDVVEEFHGHDGTGIQNGLKWGLGLLSPTSDGLIEDMVDQGHVSEDFRGRPAAFSDTAKTLILMTDGRVRFQNRPLASELVTPEQRERFELDINDPVDVAAKVGGGGSSLFARNTLFRDFQSVSTLPTQADRDDDESLRQQQVRDLCTLAQLADIKVFTIAFGFIDDDPLADGARELLQFCASEPADFFDVDTGAELAVTFDKITRLTQRLRLTK